MKERLEKWCPEYLTTGDIAKYCGVSKVTVLRWIDKENLQAFRLPGGHYRIHRDDFSEFLINHGMPIRKQMFRKNKEMEASR